MMTRMQVSTTLKHQIPAQQFQMPLKGQTRVTIGKVTIHQSSKVNAGWKEYEEEDTGAAEDDGTLVEGAEGMAGVTVVVVVVVGAVAMKMKHGKQPGDPTSPMVLGCLVHSPLPLSS
jgi:hypothetical protein